MEAYQKEDGGRLIDFAVNKVMFSLLEWGKAVKEAFLYQRKPERC